MDVVTQIEIYRLGKAILEGTQLYDDRQKLSQLVAKELYKHLCDIYAREHLPDENFDAWLMRRLFPRNAHGYPERGDGLYDNDTDVKSFFNAASWASELCFLSVFNNLIHQHNVALTGIPNKGMKDGWPFIVQITK